MPRVDTSLAATPITKGHCQELGCASRALPMGDHTISNASDAPPPFDFSEALCAFSVDTPAVYVQFCLHIAASRKAFVVSNARDAPTP